MPNSLQQQHQQNDTSVPKAKWETQMMKKIHFVWYVTLWFVCVGVPDISKDCTALIFKGQGNACWNV